MRRNCCPMAHRNPLVGGQIKQLDRRLVGSLWVSQWARPNLRLSLTLLPSLDLVEFGQRAFKFIIEQPHGIENFPKACRRFGPVDFSKGEDAVVAQISHYGWVGNSM